MKIQIMSISKSNVNYKVGDHLTVTREDASYYYIKTKSGPEKVPKKDAEVI